MPRLSLILTVLFPMFALTAQVRDSAGIRIVTNPALATAPVTHRIGDRPILSVGGLHDDPELEFQSNQGYLRGVLLSNGGLAAIDVNRVKYFDATGKMVAVAGRDGDGPGEFRYLTAICRLPGDTIVVSDRSRLGVLDGKGGFVRHIPKATHHLPFEGCFGDASVLLLEMRNNQPRPLRAMYDLQRVPVGGGVTTALGEVEGGGFEMTTMTEVIFAATGDRIVMADPLSAQLAIYSAPRSGSLQLLTIIRTADPVARITDAEAEARMASTIPRDTPEAERRARMDRMRSRPRAETWPSFGRANVDPAGNIWLADYQRTYPSAVGYTRFNPEGRITARFVLPAPTRREDRKEVIGFGADRILLRWWDDDGATHLSVFPIVAVR
jgi:hypothetical protein